MRCWRSGWTIPRKPPEDFNIQYVTHNYYGPTYRRSTYQEISPDVIALYRYQKNNRTYTVTHNEGYSYSYDSLYPQQMMQLGEPTQVLLGGNAATSPFAAICATRTPCHRRG